MNQLRPPGLTQFKRGSMLLFAIPILIVFAILFFVATHKPATAQARDAGIISGNASAVDPKDLVASKQETLPVPVPTVTATRFTPRPQIEPVATDPSLSAVPEQSVPEQPVTAQATQPPTPSPAVLERQRLADRERAAHEAPLDGGSSTSGSAGAVVKPDSITGSVASPSTQHFWLRRGMTIAATMETSIDSTAGNGGLIVAYLNDDVYDFGHHVVVAPKGAKLIGTYGTQGMTYRQGLTHVPADFDSIQVDENHVIALGDQPGVDRAGTSGLGASVNRHTRAALANFLIVTAAGALLSRNSGSCTNCSQSSSGPSAGSQIVQTGQQYFPATNQQAATLSIPEGAQISVMISTHDIDVAPWQ